MNDHRVAPVSEEAGEVRRFWERLGLPGLVDVHTHFMPERVLHKVWDYFDSVGPLTGGMEWPITYRTEEAERTAAECGAAGALWCVWWRRWFRDLPEDHPAVNEAELKLIRAGRSGQGRGHSLGHCGKHHHAADVGDCLAAGFGDATGNADPLAGPVVGGSPDYIDGRAVLAAEDILAGA